MHFAYAKTKGPGQLSTNQCICFGAKIVQAHTIPLALTLEIASLSLPSVTVQLGLCRI